MSHQLVNFLRYGKRLTEASWERVLGFSRRYNKNMSFDWLGRLIADNDLISLCLILRVQSSTSVGDIYNKLGYTVNACIKNQVFGADYWVAYLCPSKW
eukprot:g30583.t1